MLYQTGCGISSQHRTQRKVRTQVTFDQFKLIRKFSQIIGIPEFIIYPVINLSFTSDKRNTFCLIIPLKYELSVK